MLAIRIIRNCQEAVGSTRIGPSPSETCDIAMILLLVLVNLRPRDDTPVGVGGLAGRDDPPVSVGVGRVLNDWC